MIILKKHELRNVTRIYPSTTAETLTVYYEERFIKYFVKILYFLVKIKNIKNNLLVVDNKQHNIEDFISKKIK